MPPLYSLHARTLTVLYEDVERQALEQKQPFVGTAGTVIERKNAAGFRFYVHKAYDAEGKARERYLAGPVGDREADAAAEALRDRIREAKELVPKLRLLGREGYHRVDERAFATLAALHNRGVFAAGAVMVGSHAYGVLLNRLGVVGAPYTTDDVDVARAGALALDAPLVLLDVLQESGLKLFAVPQLDRKTPSTSFKVAGGGGFHVDLLAPSPDDTYPIVPVPELQAHATGLPLLGYLLAESQPGMVMTREGCCAVRIPLPERFAVHKLLVSRLRTGRSAKARKDLEQAVTLAAVLGHQFSGALEGAVAAVPKRARKHLRAALLDSEPLLAEAAPRAWAELNA